MSNKAKLAQQLKMYERIKVNELNAITRVPGGWIFEQMVSRQLCFIPWSDPLAEMERDRIVEAQLNPIRVTPAAQVQDVMSSEWVENTGSAPELHPRVDVTLSDGRVLEDQKADSLIWDLEVSETTTTTITHWRPALPQPGAS